MGTERAPRRERKRHELSQRIQLAAVAIARERGYRNVTVAEICDVVDIARSTFFLHMPSRDAAIFGIPVEMIPADQAEAILASGVGDGDHAAALLAIVVASLGDLAPHGEVVGARMELLREQPETRPQISLPLLAIMAQLEALLTGWLEADPRRRRLDHGSAAREAALTTNLVAGAMQAILTDDASGEALGPDGYAQVMADVAALVGRPGPLNR
ncbi:TetR/AcrR family transcriptional regulator [Mycetocola reblochoni]|uniref:Transcriptional regulator, TetR family n=2 Tax=Mycetocola reblochoni TaxID=331618 RepID=A0A1R4K9X3_9MICO|nr:TetR family transcriptional regulator [Mycetocola reblochoni]SJN40952.1 Transcriptional regulator, TetR family [Mycetocola reblochoni REB411]